MNEIQYVPIDDCVKVITAPKKLNRSCYLENGLFPIVDQGQEFIAGYTNDEDAIVQNDEYVIFGDHTREIKYVDFAFAQGADGVKIIKTKSNILPRYFYHSLKNVDIPNRGYNRHWSIVKDIQIPLPPLPIQLRIVEILDKFTSLVSSLDSEIALRQKQYEYYRNKLLSFEEGEEGVEMKKLKDACEIRRGIRVVKKQLKDNALYPVFQNSIAPMGYYDQNNRDGNMPYIICAGSSSGSVGYCYTPFWAADDCYTIESRMVKSRYIFYALKKNNNNLFNQVRKGSMPRLPHEAIDNMVIPVPSLTKQQRIVDILDTFESLLTNLKKERELRQKQYEYYREKLLTFA